MKNKFRKVAAMLMLTAITVTTAAILLAPAAEARFTM